MPFFQPRDARVRFLQVFSLLISFQLSYLNTLESPHYYTAQVGRRQLDAGSIRDPRGI
jgi:hypothetical protein